MRIREPSAAWPLVAKARAVRSEQRVFARVLHCRDFGTDIANPAETMFEKLQASPLAAQLTEETAQDIHPTNKLDRATSSARKSLISIVVGLLISIVPTVYC